MAEIAGAGTGDAPGALTVDRIISIHADVIAESGCTDARILSEANLHQMVFFANTIHDVYPRAAYLFFSLCAYPPFREGNERTAWGWQNRCSSMEESG